MVFVTSKLSSATSSEVLFLTAESVSLCCEDSSRHLDFRKTLKSSNNSEKCFVCAKCSHSELISHLAEITGDCFSDVNIINIPIDCTFIFFLIIICQCQHHHIIIIIMNKHFISLHDWPLTSPKDGRILKAPRVCNIPKCVSDKKCIL